MTLYAFIFTVFKKKGISEIKVSVLHAEISTFIQGVEKPAPKGGNIAEYMRHYPTDSDNALAVKYSNTKINHYE